MTRRSILDLEGVDNRFSSNMENDPPVSLPTSCCFIRTQATTNSDCDGMVLPLMLMNGLSR